MPELETDANHVFGYEPNGNPEWGKMEPKKSDEVKTCCLRRKKEPTKSELDEMKTNATDHESVPQMHSNSPKPTAKDLVGHTL